MPSKKMPPFFLLFRAKRVVIIGTIILVSLFVYSQYSKSKVRTEADGSIYQSEEVNINNMKQFNNDTYKYSFYYPSKYRTESNYGKSTEDDFGFHLAEEKFDSDFISVSTVKEIKNQSLLEYGLGLGSFYEFENHSKPKEADLATRKIIDTYYFPINNPNNVKGYEIHFTTKETYSNSDESYLQDWVVFIINIQEETNGKATALDIRGYDESSRDQEIVHSLINTLKFNN